MVIRSEKNIAYTIVVRRRTKKTAHVLSFLPFEERLRLWIRSARHKRILFFFVSGLFRQDCAERFAAIRLHLFRRFCPKLLEIRRYSRIVLGNPAKKSAARLHDNLCAVLPLFSHKPLHYFRVSVLYAAHIPAETILVQLFVCGAVPEAAGVGGNFVR